MSQSWYDALPDPVKQQIAAAALAAAQAAAGAIWSAAKARLTARGATKQQQKAMQSAIQTALREALTPTAVAISDSPEEVRHTLDLFGRWLKRPAVASEAARWLSPSPGDQIDYNILRTEFAALDLDPDALTQPFDTVVGILYDEFVHASARQRDLQPYLAVTEARAERFTLERLAPLNLDELERRYLASLYHECNELRLADAEADRPVQPRLQRVYVDVRLRDCPPTLEHVLARLGLKPAVREILAQALASIEREPNRRSPPPHTAASLDEDGVLLERLRTLDGEGWARLAKSLPLPSEPPPGGFANLTLLEVMASLDKPQVVLLGKPGGGKSTLTRRLAGLLAGLGNETLRSEWTTDEEEWAGAILGVFNRWLLPLRVVLSEWAQYAPDVPPAEGCSADLIDECWRVYQKVARPDGPNAKDRFLQKFAAEPPGVLLLLDGLDEVTDPVRRTFVLQAIRQFIGAYPLVPLIVTCRVRPYAALRQEQEALPLSDVTLDRLTPEAITHFVERWHAELVAARMWKAELAERKRQDLSGALADPTRRELQDMAGTPLLLTMMVKVNYDQSLPDSRAELYERFVQRLLSEWDRSRDDRLDELLRERGISRDLLENRLNWLAYTVHGSAGRDSVDIPVGALRALLEGLCLNLAIGDDPALVRDEDQIAMAAKWARQVMNLIDDRSGLINLEDPGTETPSHMRKARVYQFSHRTFQEYLAARWMAKGGDPDETFAAHIDDENWREAILLAIGYQCNVIGAPYDDPVQIIDDLWPEEIRNERDLARALLLGEAFVHLLGRGRTQDFKRKRYFEIVRDLERRVVEQLTAIMQEPALTAVYGDIKRQARARLTAGLLLADWGETPADLDGKDGLVDFPKSKLRVGRYPVTNLQYQRYIDAGGYLVAADGERNLWWSEQGWHYKERSAWTGPRYADDSRFHHSTQPVVGVSWYEAEAYCKWLTATWRQEGVITALEVVRLPTVAEWELVARDERDRPADEQEDYPWRGVFNPLCANTEESNVGGTTPVNMYPAGCTPRGVWDMAGNVWEWTLEKNRDEFVTLKGGAWLWEAERARASSALRPDARTTGTSISVSGWSSSPSLQASPESRMLDSVF